MKKLILFALLCIACRFSFAQQASENYRLLLKEGWNMQSAVTDQSTGAKVSNTGFNTGKWYKVSVPTTVIAGLLANKVYDFDPFYGRNFERLNDARLDKPWWFRKQFKLPGSERGKNVVLKLQGINYKANVWLNGKLIADSTQVVGPFRIIELDITKQIKYNSPNVLAVEVKRPFDPNKRGGDLAIDYADWIHYPPDFNNGIINNVEIKTFRKVGVEYPLVTTKFDLPSLAVAHLEVDAIAVNYTDEPQDALVKGKINGNSSFEQKVRLLPRQKKQVTFNALNYPQLNIKNPRIWWPWEYGKPELNRIQLSIHSSGKISNELAENFGIRQVSSVMIDSNKARKFIINGKPIMLRGAAWSPDIFQRRSKERQEQELKLVRDMNMNIVRSEGKLEDDNFYAICDREGLLVMTGWMCCGAWQYPERWDAAKRTVAMASDSSVMYWLRNKPSMLTWLNGSDMPPRDKKVEADWLSIEADLKWPNPTIASANETPSKISGPTGVKMAGPYDWVPPAYWEADTGKYGGAWSFATEISPGPSIPPYESLIKFLPKDSINTRSLDWLYHCGTMQFGNTRIFDSALYARYGTSASIIDYLNKAQLQNYEGHRAMMEAYGLRKYNNATGVVQWMLSNPWPSLIWHTYDYYLYPAGTYFGMKKSLEPLHIMYSYKSNGVDIINSTLRQYNGLQVKASIYNLDGTLKYTKETTAEVAEDGTKECFRFPMIDGLSDVYFVRLELKNAKGKVESINWYWISGKKDELNWKKSTWYYTPQSNFADYKALGSMPKTTLNINSSTAKADAGGLYNISLTNTGKTVAFFLHIRMLKEKGGDDILPIIFEDNYITLAPGESRTIKCRYEDKYAGKGAPYILVNGWNIDAAGSKTGEHIGIEK
ncbi:glycoside hydrolase family 2 protein [Mucilaginibacter xinganensis]|uniref:Glycoside hydrolase family 2 n=1 Tax=Mucilaginibacter xinganensis TaxID=1234841 RepID=A0A223NX50_9SPHI|nr:glycoside hydrolase family 2 TIM barrel-domain containing protein [Mucilaginibacter xinganensis]ASU34131.1 glycoside hydrolase family 2 [Mucilaginibacter xinganensis]